MTTPSPETEPTVPSSERVAGGWGRKTLLTLLTLAAVAVLGERILTLWVGARAELLLIP